jgi:peptidoglycan/LPS O-acetylase OafA/YrhL
VITRAAMARDADLFALSYRTFYPRRLARIYPLFLAVCVIGIGLLWFSHLSAPLYDFAIRDPAAPFDTVFWASIITFSFNIWRILNAHVTHGWGLQWDVMWSLSVEEQFYVAFPLIIAISKNKKNFLILLSLIIFVSVGYRLVHRWDWSPYDSIVSFELIATGVGAAIYVPTIPRNLRAPLTLLGIVALCGGAFVPHNTRLSIINQEFIAVGSGILLCCAASARRRLPVWLLPLAFAGELSYGLYLLHPAILYLTGGIIRGFGYYWGFLIYVAISIAVASVSYRFYENPARKIVYHIFTVTTSRRVLPIAR